MHCKGGKSLYFELFKRYIRKDDHNSILSIVQLVQKKLECINLIFLRYLHLDMIIRTLTLTATDTFLMRKL